MGLNYYASSSPTVVLNPQPAPSYFDSIPSSGHHSPALTPNSCPMGRKYPVPPSLNYLAAVNNSAAGRKRSIHDVEPEDLPADCPGAVPVPPKPKVEPIYGPGMTLIYPDEPGLNISAESQTGTWAEEKHDEEEKEVTPVRPIAVARKSQRLDSISQPSPSSPPKRQDSIIDENGNTLDQLILALGIGWKKMMDNPAVETMARAYTRVIENHFPLKDATVMVQNEGLQAYLVRASENGNVKFWLFDDSLRWCQLLSNTLQGAVNNIRAGPTPMVEGPIINAQRTPSPPPSTADVEIDMAANVPLPMEAEAMQM